MKTHSSLLVLVASAASSTCLLAQPVITQQPADQVVLNGESTTFSVAVSGTGPFTYQWHFNGADIGPFICTVAGNDTWIFSGDGGQATNAFLYYPNDVAMDRAGNLFIGLSLDGRVRKVDTNGIITTVAGNGSRGYNGDNMAATNATLNEPGGVAVDGVGNLFIADSANNRIRKVDTNGIITTVAGTGSTGYSGDNVAATNTSLYSPSGVAVDGAGNLLIADSVNNRIRKMDTNGIITTVAGNGGRGFSGDNVAATNTFLASPTGVAVDSAGNLFIADTGNNRIRKMDTNGIITTVAGNGSTGYSGDNVAATNTSLYSPHGPAVDRAGNLFIADYYNHRIRKVDGNGIITTIAGNGSPRFAGDGNPAIDASLYYPSGVTTDGFDNLFIADHHNLRIRKVFSRPATLPVLALGKITTNNIGSYSVVISDSTGSVTSSVAALNMPAYFALQPTGQTVWPGASASFASLADGSQPIRYQWSCNGTNLNGATNASCTITNIAPANAGSYAVTAINRYGIVTSFPAMLVVSPCTPVPAGAVAWWRGEYDLWDAVGVNDATPLSYLDTNSFVYVPFGGGKVGLTFYPSASIVVAPTEELNLGAGQGFTVEGWVIVNGPPGLKPILSWNDSRGNIGAGLSIRIITTPPPPPP